MSKLSAILFLYCSVLSHHSWATSTSVKANSQIVMPHNLYLADIDNDQTTDYIQIVDNKLFGLHTNYEQTGFLHLFLEKKIKRVMTGDFAGEGYDQTCLLMEDASLRCYKIAPDRKSLRWWFTQPNFIGDSEDFIVGDYDGNGRDEILVYPPSTGGVKVYSLESSGRFQPMPKFNSGNITNLSPKVRIRAGDFSGDGRTDLIVITPEGLILYYASVNDNGTSTFWWAFNTADGFVGANDEVSIAKVGDSVIDNVIIRNTLTGATRLLKVDWNNGNPYPAIQDVEIGQISVQPNSQLFWGQMKGRVDEPGNKNRHDTLVFEKNSGLIVRADARWSGSKLTYWWAYNQHPSQRHTGWKQADTSPWLILKCKFSDEQQEPQTPDFFQKLFLYKVTDALVGFFLDASYGTLNLSGSQLHDNWYTMQNTSIEDTHLSRDQIIDRCIVASRVNRSANPHILVLTNATPSADAGTPTSGVLLDPTEWQVHTAVQQVARAYGLGHSFDDSSRVSSGFPNSQPGEYFDYWDTLSAPSVYKLKNSMGLAAGPELNAPARARAGWIPANRITELRIGNGSQQAEVYLAAIHRPEVNAPLMVKIFSESKRYYTVEFREKSQWDAAIPQDTILIHEVKNGMSYLQTQNGGPEFLPGETFEVPNLLKVTVELFNPADGSARLKIQY